MGALEKGALVVGGGALLWFGYQYWSKQQRKGAIQDVGSGGVGSGGAERDNLIDKGRLEKAVDSGETLYGELKSLYNKVKG